MEACNRHEKTCDELVKHTFPGGKNIKEEQIKIIHQLKKQNIQEKKLLFMILMV